MKSNKEFRGYNDRAEESLRKAVKLEPNKKSGKEKHAMYSELDEEDDLLDYKKRESILDYYDDVDEEPDYDEDEEYEDEEDIYDTEPEEAFQ